LTPIAGGATAVVIGGASAASAPCATPGELAPQPILRDAKFRN